MKNGNWEQNLDSSLEKYHDAQFLITILEDEIGKSLNDIKVEVNKAAVCVTKEQIEEYLDKKFEEEDPELKKRMEKPKSFSSIENDKGVLNFNPVNAQDFEIESQYFFDSIDASRYYFEPFTLEYFNTYITIVKNKLKSLLNIIEKIGIGDSYSIKDLLRDFDIQLDSNGNILKEDIKRLIVPAIYNYNVLSKKVVEANNLETYLTFKQSKHSLARDGFSLNEIYPTKSLQVKNMHYSNLKGNIPLSVNQKKELDASISRNIRANVKILLG